MEKTLSKFHNDYLSLLLARAKMGSFLIFTMGTLGQGKGVLEIKYLKALVPSIPKPTEISHSPICQYATSNNHQNCCYSVPSCLRLQFHFQVSITRVFLSGCASISIFPGGNFPCKFNSLSPRKVTDFQFIQVFLLVRMHVIVTKVFK